MVKVARKRINSKITTKNKVVELEGRQKGDIGSRMVDVISSGNFVDVVEYGKKVARNRENMFASDAYSLGKIAMPIQL